MSSSAPVRRLATAALTLAVAASTAALTAPASSASTAPDKTSGTGEITRFAVGPRVPTYPGIVGGTTTSTTKYSWQVRLEISTAQGTGLCGGAIIHSRVVLTAAHCLEGATGAVASFGRDLASGGGVGSSAVGSYTTPSYNRSTFENDYGFLFFDTPIPAAFRPVQVAGPTETALWRAGRVASIAGFGNISEGGTTSPTLQEVAMPIHADATCGAPTSYGTQFRAANMLCAGAIEGGRSTCQGDSGGPLVVPGDNGVWRIAGLVSWANGCARPNFPTVFTRIAEPAVSALMLAELTQIRDANPTLFPGLESALPILGAGAVPVGCTAAQGAAAAAAVAVTPAQAAATSAATQATKAKKKAKAAKKKLKKAKKKHAGKAAIKKLTKKAKKLKKKSRAATARSNGASAALVAAQQASAASAATATSTCT